MKMNAKMQQAMQLTDKRNVLAAEWERLYETDAPRQERQPISDQIAALDAEIAALDAEITSECANENRRED
jgi:hypothetical protein